MPASDAAVTATDPRPPADTAPAMDAAQARLQRTLKLVVAGLAALLLAGLLTVVGRVIYLASSPRTQPGAATAAAPAPASAGAGAIRPELKLALPPGAQVKSVSLAGNRLAVHYDAGAGSGIAVIDLETGRTITNVAIEPQVAPR
jgi:hypothetical protein